MGGRRDCGEDGSVGGRLRVRKTYLAQEVGQTFVSRVMKMEGAGTGGWGPSREAGAGKLSCRSGCWFTLMLDVSICIAATLCSFPVNRACVRVCVCVRVSL